MVYALDTHLNYTSLISGSRISYAASSAQANKSGKKKAGAMPVFT